MSAVMAPQLVDLIDTAKSKRAYSSGTIRPLTSCVVADWGLALECPTPDDPLHHSEFSWLLPADDVRLTFLRPRHGTGTTAVELTAVRIHREARQWRTVDLLLGLSLRPGSSARVARFEEFAAAVAGGVVRPGDGDLAVSTIHRVLDQLARRQHSLDSWLAGRGIPARLRPCHARHRA